MSGGLVVLGTLTLPGVRRSVGYARRFLRDLLPPGHPALDDLVTVGRGLRIVEALTESRGFRTDGDRTIVWARFRSPCGILIGNTDRGLSQRSRTLVPAAFEGGDR